MNLLAVTNASLLVLGAIIAFNTSSTLAQPCENNGHAVLGKGKQIFKQSNHCIIVENNVPNTSQPPPTSICGTNSVLQNGVCVPTNSSSICGTNSVLQNGVCVPIITNSTNGVCGANSILQNGVCVPITATTKDRIAPAN